MIVQGGVVLCSGHLERERPSEPPSKRVACENVARYINARGELCCSLCPIKEGIDSLKIDDVGKLITGARELISRCLELPLVEAVTIAGPLRELVSVMQVQVKPLPEPEPTPAELERRAQKKHDAEAQLIEDVSKCRCHRPGWIGGSHDDPNCEYAR